MEENSKFELKYWSKNGPIYSCLLYNKEKNTNHNVVIDTITNEFICDCEDFFYRKKTCKHIKALLAKLDMAEAIRSLQT